METLKKAFRGYRTADVDKLLQDLQSQLQTAQSRCAELERQLSETKQEADESRQAALKAEEKLNAGKVKLEKANWESEQLRIQMSLKQNQAEMIGGIYLKAFENGRDIITSSKAHTEQFLETVEDVTKKAQFDFSYAEKNLTDTAGAMIGLAAEINRQTELLKHTLAELAVNAGKIGNAYEDFEQVKTKTNTEIGKIQKQYDDIMDDLLDTKSVSPIPTHAVFGDDLHKEQIFEEKPLEKTLSGESEEKFDDLETHLADLKMEDIASAEDIASPEDVASAESISAMDTAADFLDDDDVSADEAEESKKAVQEKKEEYMRGQNILTLLNKYQKK